MVLSRAAASLVCMVTLAGWQDPAAQPGARAGLATLRGRVEVLRRITPPVERPNAAEPGDLLARDAVNRRRAVVYFETAPRGAFEDREGARASMDQRNETFVPHILAITAGTVVDFPNNDRTYHNVFSLSKARRFDLGRYAAGRSKAVRFDHPGIVRVFCDIHSHMNAFILVFGHRFFAVTGADGRYQIDSVPAGTYTLSAWLDGAVRAQRTVTIGPDSRIVELDFTVR